MQPGIDPSKAATPIWLILEFLRPLKKCPFDSRSIDSISIIMMHTSPVIMIELSKMSVNMCISIPFRLILSSL